MENKLTEKESLDLIVGMIENAKQNVQKGFGNHFLLWGYFVLVSGLWQFLTLNTSLHEYSGWGWLLMIPVTLVGRFIINRKRNRAGRVYTYTDALIANTWLAFGISIGVLAIPVFGLMKASGNSFYFYPALLFLASVALLVSGTAYRFSLLKWGAVVCWLCGFACYFVSWKYNVLLNVVAFVLAFIIPGHLLNRKEGRHV